MSNAKRNMKKAAILVFAGAAFLTAFDYYLLRREKKRWDVMWNISPSAFYISGKKATRWKKSR